MNVEKKTLSVVMFWLKLDLSRILVAEQLTMEYELIIFAQNLEVPTIVIVIKFIKTSKL
jgi:hypothetical protein